MSTIADVAREAGVSVSTVSHVVNGTRRVSPADRKRGEGGHRRDRLSPERHCALVEDRLDPLSRDRHFGDRQSLLHRHHLRDRDECARLGMMIFLSDTQDDPARELQVLTALHQRRVDGVIPAAERRPRTAGSCLLAIDAPPVRPG